MESVFGALHVAQYSEEHGGELLYAGSVGTGFTDEVINEIMEALVEASSDSGAKPNRPAFGGNVPKGPSHHWVHPEVVAEVRYKEFTKAGVIRYPSFVRLRGDKRAEECARQNDDLGCGPPPRWCAFGHWGAGANGRVSAAARSDARNRSERRAHGALHESR
jgi:bifunctional non-homologous end joining protein LigD